MNSTRTSFLRPSFRTYRRFGTSFILKLQALSNVEEGEPNPLVRDHFHVVCSKSQRKMRRRTINTINSPFSCISASTSHEQLMNTFTKLYKNYNQSSDYYLIPALVVGLFLCLQRKSNSLLTRSKTKLWKKTQLTIAKPPVNITLVRKQNSFGITFSRKSWKHQLARFHTALKSLS